MTLLLRTFTGKDVDVLALEPRDIDIRDIAHALALQSRFHGHCRFHYSVAQHSMLAAQRVHELTGESLRTLKALLHDANETYLGDMSRPLKYTPVMEPYRNLARKVQRVVDRAFGLELNDDPILEHVDRELLYLESQALFDPPLKQVVPASPSWSAKITHWDPSMVENSFLAYFQALTNPTIQFNGR